MADTTRIPDVMLERYLAGDLRPEQRSRIEDAMRSTPAVAARLREITTERNVFLAASPPEAAAHRLATRLTIDGQPRSRWQAWYLLPPVGVAAALIFGIVYQKALGPQSIASAPAVVVSDEAYELAPPAPSTPTAWAAPPEPVEQRGAQLEQAPADKRALDRAADAELARKVERVESKSVKKESPSKDVVGFGDAADRESTIGGSVGALGGKGQSYAQPPGDAAATGSATRGEEKSKSARAQVESEIAVEADGRRAGVGAQAGARAEAGSGSGTGSGSGSGAGAGAGAQAAPSPADEAAKKPASKSAESAMADRSVAANAAPAAPTGGARPAPKSAREPAPSQVEPQDASTPSSTSAPRLPSASSPAPTPDSAPAAAPSPPPAPAVREGPAKSERLRDPDDAQAKLDSAKAVITLTRQSAGRSQPLAQKDLVAGGMTLIAGSTFPSGVLTVIGVRPDGKTHVYGQVTLHGAPATLSVTIRPATMRMSEALFISVTDAPVKLETAVGANRDAQRLPLRLEISGTQRRFVITVAPSAN